MAQDEPAQPRPGGTGEITPGRPGRDEFRFTARCRQLSGGQDVGKRRRGQECAVGVPELVRFQVQEPGTLFGQDMPAFPAVRHHRHPGLVFLRIPLPDLDDAEQAPQGKMRLVIKTLVPEQQYGMLFECPAYPCVVRGRVSQVNAFDLHAEVVMQGFHGPAPFSLIPSRDMPRGESGRPFPCPRRYMGQPPRSMSAPRSWCIGPSQAWSMFPADCAHIGNAGKKGTREKGRSLQQDGRGWHAAVRGRHFRDSFRHAHDLSHGPTGKDYNPSIR